MPITQVIKLTEPVKVIRKPTLTQENIYRYGKASEEYNISLKIFNLSDFSLIETLFLNITPIQFSTSTVQGAGVITRERWSAKAGQPYLDGELDVKSGFIWLANQLNHASAESPQSLNLSDNLNLELTSAFITINSVSYPCESWTVEKNLYGGSFSIVKADYDIFQPISPSVNEWTFKININDYTRLYNIQSFALLDSISFTDGFTSLIRQGVVQEINITEKAGIPNYWEIEIKVYERIDPQLAITFTILDTKSNPVPGIQVTIGNQTLYTNSQGIAGPFLIANNYNDVVLTLTVKDGSGNPLSGISVILGNVSKITNASGQVVFYISGVGIVS